MTNMVITFTKLVEGEGFQDRVFIVKKIKYRKNMIAIDIVDVGWRTLTNDMYDTFDIQPLADTDF